MPAPATLPYRTTQFYIDGQWTDPAQSRTIDVINPATGAACAQIALGGLADVERAVAAARRAFPAFSATSRGQRMDLLARIEAAFRRRQPELAAAVTLEMGSPAALSWDMQTGSSLIYLQDARRTLERFAFSACEGDTVIAYEPIGVCALITPWNWPLNQIITKLAPALAAGCTVILKPSELAPLSPLLLAQVLHEAEVPPGVFNLVNGDGAGVGQMLSAHPEVDMVSFTGSTRAGILVAKAAADTVKRVHQELGGKSAAIILPDADLDLAVRDVVQRCFINSGQSCIAPSRLLVPHSILRAVLERARAAAAQVVPGDPADPATSMGPVNGAAQFAKVQRLIRAGLDAGATLIAGGPGRPEGLEDGFYCRPTILADVTPAMPVAREEIFGPVLSILTYGDEQQAVAIANDTPYGLAAYVYAADRAAGRRVAAALRAGRVFINNPAFDFHAPFGGYKQSGNGRELGEHGLREFLEVKAVLGYGAG